MTAMSPEQITLDDLRAMKCATISLKTAAAVLDVDVRTAGKAAQDGSIPAIHIGRRVLIPRERFIQLLGAEEQAEPEPNELVLLTGT